MRARMVSIVLFVSAILVVLSGYTECVRIRFGFVPRHGKWTDSAYRFIANLDCDLQTVVSYSDCWSLKRIAKSSMNVYVSEAVNGRKVVATLPDATLGNLHGHGAVLAIDPYPEASFGHLVLIFFIDKNSTEQLCKLRGTSVYVAETGDCLSLSLKTNCMENYLGSNEHRPQCDNHFLPLVYAKDDANRHKMQTLKCIDHISGFGKCRKLRRSNETLSLMCDPVHVNTHHCSSIFGTVHTHCRIFQTCDQAVLLTSGWDHHSTLPEHYENTKDVYRMLRSNGFIKRNIKVFYANGLDRPLQVDGETHSVFPSAKRIAMQYHLDKMCSSSRCVDSLVIYMNGPAMSDGSLLLWDIDGDGLAGRYEKYTINDLMEDLENCQARRVFIIADYSFSGKLIEKFNSSDKHKNVQVFTSGRSDEYSWKREFTNHWVNFNHFHTCASQVQIASQKAVRHSNPQWVFGSSRATKTNIFGAPCGGNLYPPLTKHEMRRNYLGCQSVPTKLWMTKISDYD